MVEKARMESGAVRAEAAAAVSREAAAADEEMLQRARDEADEIKRRGESRVPQLAAVIVADLVRDLLSSASGAGAENSTE